MLMQARSLFTGVPEVLRDRNRRWKIILPALAVIAVIGGALYYYRAVYLPARSTQQAALQTTVARRGDIILSASGTGTLQAANQQDLAFGATGTLAQLNVQVGDQVKKGQVLAQLDNSTQALALQQAQQNLESLTSTSAVGAAQASLAQATQQLESAQLQLEYLISPDVYYWENQVAAEQQKLAEAQAALTASPSDPTAKANVEHMQAVLSFFQDKLTEAHKAYKDYEIQTFMGKVYDPATKKDVTEVLWTTDAEVTKARQNIVIAQGAVDDAQALYSALTGGTIPANASGSGLAALQSARIALQTAQDNLAATQLLAPFSGTVTAVSAQVGDSVGSSSVISLADLSHLYLQTFVDPSDYSMFQVGNSASVVFDALPDQTFSGKVVQVSPALDTSSGSSVVSGLVQLDPTSAKLLIGMSASVDVIAGQARNAVLVPLAALHEYSPGQYAVFVERGGKLQVAFVQVGLKDLVSAEVKSGLQAGDVISTGMTATK
jgi:HlyD family secretion protein